ncbi:MAG: hypothetical protein IJT02_06425 [Synergistaceae bacterium]|nr:hypothetical protein [Synergistaceae bacterium]
MRKIFGVLVLLLVMVSPSVSLGLELPDSVGEWRSVNEHVVPLVLSADSEDLGRIVYRDYIRESPRGSLQVILTEGAGTGSLYVPERVRDSKGMMPSDSLYRVLDVAGHGAILEAQSYMPVALAVKAGDNIVLTIETASLSEAEVVKFAEEILSLWSSTK